MTIICVFRLFEPDGTLSEQSFFLANSLQASGGPFFPDRQGFLNPRFIDNSIRGLLRSPVESVDVYVAEDIHSKMFRYRIIFKLTYSCIMLLDYGIRQMMFLIITDFRATLWGLI
jgi:hypothetical protein